jgi:hypothetical protein
MWFGRWTIIFVLIAAGSAADAQEEFAASFRLRGGYDSNPNLAPNGKGSALIAWDAAAVYGRDHGEWISGATAEASLTRYRSDQFEPAQSYRLRLRLTNKNQNDISLDATTTLAYASNYDTRSDFLNQRVHAQWTGGALRPFAAGDLKFASLNEVNVLLGEFLPEPMRYLRGTITTGIAYVNDKTEAGVQIALARTKYQQEPDLFGFQRDNDRVQPGVYAKYSADNLALSGTLSYLRAYSQEEFFSDVSVYLFELSLTAKFEGWSGELSVARTAEDTTFPISPVTINTALQAKLMREVGEKTSAGIFGRVVQRKYWDSPFFSRTRVAGIEVTHEIREDILLASELGFAKSLLITGAEADGVVAMFALTKRFGDKPKN